MEQSCNIVFRFDEFVVNDEENGRSNSEECMKTNDNN